MPRPTLDQIFSQSDYSKPEVRNAAMQELYGQPQRPPLDAIFAKPVKQEAPKVGAGRTALEQGLQGATFGFADEITDRIGAGIASLATGEAYSNLLNEARGASKERMAAQFEQRPGLSIAANLAGGLLTGVAGASTKAGTALTNSLRTGGTAARIGKGTLAGAASGGLYGAGTADEGKRLSGAGQGAIIGGAFGAALPAVGAAASGLNKGAKNARTGVSARTVEQLDEALAAIKDRSSQAYQAMRDAGAVINRPRAINIANRVEAAVKASGAINPRLHSTTIGLLDDFKQASRAGEMSLDDLDKWRQTFGQVAGNFNDKLNQRNASIAIDAIDEAVDKLSKIDLRGGKTKAIEALNLGRSEWARARKFERIADVVKKSEGDPNYIKRELRKILVDPKKRRGFSAEEISALKEASRLTTGEGILKSLGKFGFDVGAPTRIGNTALPVGGIALGAPGLTAAGTAARQLQKLLGRGKAEQLLRVIESGQAPIARTALPRTTGITPALLGGQMGILQQ